MTNFTDSIKGSGKPDKGPEFNNANICCRAVPLPVFITSTRRTMKRNQRFEPTPAEVAYWAKIHQLNAESYRQDEQSEPVNYVVTTVEIVTVEGDK